MDTNKNSYTLIYMVIMIIIVSLLLSITSGLLKSRQDKNIALDTKKQILSSLPAITLEGNDADVLFNETIKEYRIVSPEGEVIKTLNTQEGFNYSTQKNEYPIIVANIDGEEKYILRLDGKGLWDAIWGYIAINADRSTVYGVYFSHKGETPGLGANITKETFQVQFKDKHIRSNGNFTSIAVMKKGQTDTSREQVDAISGATITSKGVETMLFESLKHYQGFFNNTQKKSEVVHLTYEGDKK